MLLQLTQVFDIEGNEAEVNFPLDLSDCDIDGFHPFDHPVTVSAKAVNRAGIVTLSYSITSAIHLRCDRCLTIFPYHLDISGKQVLVRKIYGEDSLNEDYLEVAEGSLDVSELARDEIFLHLPSKVLCKDDCKGICPICGINRNEKTCQCEGKKVDSRLQILGQLLEQLSDDSEQE
jgi:uncharacterized protein